MPRYQLSLRDDDVESLLNDVCSMNPFPIEVLERRYNGHMRYTILNLTLTEEEYVFLSLKYKFISSHEITAVDVVSAIINA